MAVCGKGECTKTELADILFLVDGSTSIAEKDFQNMLKFMKSIVNASTVGENETRFGVVLYSTAPTSVFTLDEYSSKGQVLEAIQALQLPHGDTYTGRALAYTLQFFEVAHGGRRPSKVPQILMVITDGEATDPDKLKGPAEALREKGVVVYSIGVKGANQKELETISGNPTRVFFVDNFIDLDTLSKEICIDTPPGCKKRKADLVLLIDQSGSISGADYTTLKDFMISLIRSFNVSQDLVHVAVAQFDSAPQHEFYLNRFATEAEVTEHVLAMVQRGGGTKIGRALDFIKGYFQTSTGSRVGAGVSQNLVLMTDGQSQDDVGPLAKVLLGMGIETFVIGIGDTDQQQLKEITNKPFTVENFSSLANIKTNVVQTICDSVPPGESPSLVRLLRQIKTVVPDPKVIQGTQEMKELLAIEALQGSGEPKAAMDARGQEGRRVKLEIMEWTETKESRVQRAWKELREGKEIPGTRATRGSQEREESKDNEDSEETRGPLAQTTQWWDLKGILGTLACWDPKGGGDPWDHRASVERGAVEEEQAAQAPPASGDPRGSEVSRASEESRDLLELRAGPVTRDQAVWLDDGEPMDRRDNQGTPGHKGGQALWGPEEFQGKMAEMGMEYLDRKELRATPVSMETLAFRGLVCDGVFLLPVQGKIGVKGGPAGPGPKGPLGRGEVAGHPGESGQGGGPGHPGHKGPRGPPGDRNMSECELINYIRSNCVCCQGSPCPARPTELVFGLDMSQGVTPGAFERTRAALLALLEGVAVAESNCPKGARVAVVGYSAHTKHLVRFHDYRCKKQLLELVRNIALERTSNARRLGGAMRFVGAHVFKRVRRGPRVRKVAVFFSHGPSRDGDDIVTAVMEYRALDVVPAVLALDRCEETRKAFEADHTGSSVFLTLGHSGNLTSDLEPIKSCVICHDPCRPQAGCVSGPGAPGPQVLDVDLALVVDGSRKVPAHLYSGLRVLLGSVVEQVSVSGQPRQADGRARVALVQQSGRLHSQAPAAAGPQAATVEFGLLSGLGSSQMRSHLLERMTQQGGPSALGHTLEHALREVLLRAPSPRKHRVLLVGVGARTSSWDQDKLRRVALEAKCRGVAVLVVALGDSYSQEQVAELASGPLKQHLLCLGGLGPEEQGYARRFIATWLSVLRDGLNTYPPVSLKKSCDLLHDVDRRAEQVPVDPWEEQSGSSPDTTLRDQADPVWPVLSADAGLFLRATPD
ncbi:unnamed protein product, partial [Arctogadus glacialis]